MTQLRKFSFVLLLAASFVHLSEQQCTKYYTVQSGDYCYKIWTDNGLTQQQFYSLNPGIDCNNLQIGQSVCVGGTVPPTQPPQATCGKYYTVVSGDTCWQIWTNNGLTEQQFYALNPGINCGDLKIGQQVCVAAGSGPAATTKSSGGSGTTIPSGNTGTNRVVGYYPTWSTRPFSPTQAQLLTHVTVAFPTMNSDGSLSFDDGGHAITQVKQVAASYPNLKVMFSVGGAGNSQYYSNVAANPTTLITNILNIIDTYNLDGVDIDWENPTTAADKSNYVSLMQKLRSALDQHQVAKGRSAKYLLSFAGAPGQWTLDPGYDLPGLLNYVDFVNVMTYDYYGTWSGYTGPASPLYGVGAQSQQLNVDWTLNYYACKTSKPSKLNLGIPFYGPYWKNVGGMAGSDPMYRVATGVNGQYAGGSIAWKDIPSSWNLASASWDDGAKVPYIFDSANRKLLGFENPASIGYKGQYAAQKNIGGLMIWDLDQDDDQFSMLKAVAQGAAGLHNSDVVNYTC